MYHYIKELFLFLVTKITFYYFFKNFKEIIFLKILIKNLFKYRFIFSTLQRYGLYFNLQTFSRKIFEKMNIFIFKIILVKNL